MKKVLAFDLDGTLAPSKSTLPPRMGVLLDQLLDYFEICVISGGKFGQFETQLLEGLPSSPEKLAKLHLMPTCGTQYYKLNGSDWNQVYAENFTDDEKSRIITALENGIDALGYRETKVYGEIIDPPSRTWPSSSRSSAAVTCRSSMSALRRTSGRAPPID